MKFLDMFKRVKTISVDETKTMIRDKPFGSYTLLDVREPGEYEAGHIPGAVFISLAQLPERLSELDPGKPIVAYWKIGGRSRSAANYLSGQSFRAASMRGGFHAWNGIASQAEVDQGMYLIEGDETPQQLLALSYGLEDGNRKFYVAISQTTDDEEVRSLFRKLSEKEEQHKQRIWDCYRNITDSETDRERFEDTVVKGVLEHGKTAKETLDGVIEWVQRVSDAMELAMALETDALDLYLRMAQKTKDGPSQKVFFALAEEERMHLQDLSRLFQRKIGL